MQTRTGNLLASRGFLDLHRTSATFGRFATNPEYFAEWDTRHFGDAQRAIEQMPPPRKRNLLVRASKRFPRDARERAAPTHRKAANQRNFYDAQDAVAPESAINEFGYSFLDLIRKPGP